MREPAPDKSTPVFKSKFWQIGSMVISVCLLGVTAWAVVSSFGPIGYIRRVIDTTRAGSHPDPDSGRPGFPFGYYNVGSGLSGPAPGIRYYCRSSRPTTLDSMTDLVDAIPVRIMTAIGCILTSPLAFLIHGFNLFTSIKSGTAISKKDVWSALGVFIVWFILCFIFFITPMLEPC